MAKKFFVLAAMVAMALTASAPAAFAHGGQEGVVGPLPVEWTGEEATITGLLEPAGQKLDGTPIWNMRDEASGGFYHVEQGEGVALAAFEGQRVTLHGTLGQLEGAVILVHGVDQPQDETAAGTRYKPEQAAGEEFAGTGTVEYLGEKADGTPVYGLSVSPEEGFYVEGDFDFAAFEGREVSVTGRIVYASGGGSYLRVETMEPIGGAPVVEETAPEASPEPAEVVVEEAGEAAPAVSRETTETLDEAAEETVSVDLASEETPLVPGSADEPGIFSAAAKSLPVTGGIALLLPLAGLVLVAAGLAAVRRTR